MPVLELKQVSKGFGEGKSRSEVLNQIDLTIEEGEFVAIVGFTGSGKTTLIKLMAGLIQPDKGEVLFKGKPIVGPSHERSVIFQNYSLLPWLTVYQNVALAVNEVYPSWSKKEKDAHVRHFVDMVNLTPALQKRPAELSGGMRQRVAVARSLSMQPEMLLMDEPLSALDALTRGNLQEEILNIWSKDQRTALLITNDVDEGILMADRIIPLNPGPNATLGPEFKIEIDRPRDKAALNEDPHFINTRNQIINYLMDLGEAHKLQKDQAYELPDLEPMAVGSRTFTFK